MEKRSVVGKASVLMETKRSGKIGLGYVGERQRIRSASEMEKK
jgi:hypothetical protein